MQTYSAAIPRPLSPVGPVLVPVMGIAREALVAGIVAVSLTAMVAPSDVGLSFRPHPAWAAVLILAARYGSRGLAVALPVVAGTLILAASIVGLGVMDPIWVVSASNVDLGVLLVSVLVAWVASIHEQRTAKLTQQVTEMERRCVDADFTSGQLREAAVALRARADRLEHSLTFLRGVAGALEGSDSVGGAQAALDLAMARTGARGGLVELADHGRRRTVAWKGTWSVETAIPPCLLGDRTAHAAFETGAPARGSNLSDFGPDDSDIAVPIPDETGDVVGIMALRGVPLDSLRAAGAHDVALIAQWCGKSFAADRGQKHAGPLEAARDEASAPAAGSMVA